jgi:hypothetical protein
LILLIEFDGRLPMSTLPHEFEPLEYNVDLEHGLVWHVLGFFSIGEDGNPILRGDSCFNAKERERLKQGAQIAVASYLRDVRHVWGAETPRRVNVYRKVGSAPT